MSHGGCMQSVSYIAEPCYRSKDKLVDVEARALKLALTKHVFSTRLGAPQAVEKNGDRRDIAQNQRRVCTRNQIFAAL